MLHKLTFVSISIKQIMHFSKFSKIFLFIRLSMFESRTYKPIHLYLFGGGNNSQKISMMKVFMVANFNSYFINLYYNHMHNKVLVVENNSLASYCEDGNLKHSVVDLFYQVGPFVFSQGPKWLMVIFFENESSKILTCFPLIFCGVSEKSS